MSKEITVKAWLERDAWGFYEVRRRGRGKRRGVQLFMACGEWWHRNMPKSLHLNRRSPAIPIEIEVRRADA